MSEKYIKSDQINVYPTTTRDDDLDRNSRLQSEQNLISIINRLVDKDAFIIDGFDIAPSGNILKPGSCNIHGYYFNITNEILLTDYFAANTWAENDIIYFRISVKQVTNNSLTLNELQGLDQGVGDSRRYSGLELIKLAAGSDLPKADGLDTYYYLPIIQYKNNAWGSVKYNKSKFIGDEVTLTVAKNITTDITENTEFSITDFINNSLKNLIIDDGDL